MTEFPDPELEEEKALFSLARFRDASVLEVGCGDGRLTSLFAREAAIVVGLDSDSEELAAASEELGPTSEGKVGLVLGDAQTLPIAGESVDLVVLAWSL